MTIEHDFSGHGFEFAEALEGLRDETFFDKTHKNQRRQMEAQARPLYVLPVEYEPYLGQDSNDFIEHNQATFQRYGVHPEIWEFTEAFVAECAGLSIPMFPNELIRSAERQAELKQGGFTKSGTVGAHLVGCAVDLVHTERAWGLTNREWLVLGHIGKELAARRGFQVNWGGDWKADTNPSAPKVGWDPAHWELAYWKAAASDYPFRVIDPKARRDFRCKHRLPRFDRKEVLM